MAFLFIPYNTPSLKNSKIATKRGVFFSKTVRKYLQNLGIKNYSVSKRTAEDYKKRPNTFRDIVNIMKREFEQYGDPKCIGLFFVRNSIRKFDWLNAAQIICDLLVAHKVIKDDNMDCLIPMPFQMNGKWYDIDKDNPGCWIKY